MQLACRDSGIPGAGEIRTWVQRAIAASGRAPHDNAEVAVRVVDADEIRRLNTLYRQQEKTTNVLAFPAAAIDGLPEGESLMLGDLVVCAAVVRDEAEQQGKVLADHWAHMLVHGALHLLGFDHDAETAATEMERLERKILARHGVSDPYTSR